VEKSTGCRVSGGDLSPRSDLDLCFLDDAEVKQLSLDRYQLQVHSHRSASISVENRWELEDELGRVIHRGSPGVEGESCLLLRLLGRCVVGSAVAASSSFSLDFDGERRLRV
jgi:hypothetical protein